MNAAMLKIETFSPSMNNENSWLLPQENSKFVSEYDTNLEDLLSLIGEQEWEEACPDGCIIP